MKALADLNILLDLMLDRQPWAADAAALWQAHQDCRLELLVASFTVPTLFYIVRRHKDLAAGHTAVKSVLTTLTIVPVDRATLQLACSFTGSDFEDNLQIACAAQAQVDAIITRDSKDFSGSSIPIWTPTEALTHLPST